MSDPLVKAVTNFFTNTDPLPKCPPGLEGQVWWDRRERWSFPWRIVRYENGIAQGYPCGEPALDNA